MIRKLVGEFTFALHDDEGGSDLKDVLSIYDRNGGWFLFSICEHGMFRHTAIGRRHHGEAYDLDIFSQLRVIGVDLL